MKIIINSHAQSRVVPFCVNGKWRHIEVGVEATVPDEWESVLRDARIDFTVIGEDAVADEDDSAPTQDDNSTTDTGNPLLSILDGNVGAVTSALEGKSKDELETLLAAEQAGKTRSTVVAAIEKAIADLASA